MKMIVLLCLGLMLSLPVMAEDHALNYGLDGSVQVTLGDELSAQDVRYNFNFGRTKVGTRKMGVLTLRNTRNPIIINEIETEGFGFSSRHNCPRILLKGRSCKIRMFFRPDRVGSFRGELQIDLTGARDIEVRLRGRGVR